jgi:hypothetical protein
MNKQKNSFFTFICSLIPGVGEMYIGKMNMGSGIMLLFFCIAILASTYQITLLTMFVPVIWFYSFFHTHYLNSLDNERLAQINDNFLPKDVNFVIFPLTNNSKKGLGIFLVLIGTSSAWSLLRNLLWSLELRFYLPPILNAALNNFMYYAPQALLSLIIIIVGLKLIFIKKKELDATEKL